MSEFKLFQKYFLEYQKLFGLGGYKVYFKHEPLADGFANITVAQADMVATVRLNSALSDREKPFMDVKQSAKHEALHLLLMRLEQLADYRYAQTSEICESVEELVHKLEGLIK